MRPAIKVLVAIAALAIAACQSKPDIPLAPYAKDYRTKPDFARLEHELPLTRAHLMSLTPQNVARLDQEEIDQVYARLTAGPIPDGAYEGTFFSARGGGLQRVPEILGGLMGVAVDAKIALLERVGGKLWQGKVFYRDKREVRNLITDRRSVDYRDAWLLSSARLYCGQSLLDGRRESIVIAYAFSDEQHGNQARTGGLSGRNASRIRDEIRMVRPGFYLGRAYLSRVFVLNFTLANEKVEKEQGDAFSKTGRIDEDCWPGHQRLIASN